MADLDAVVAWIGGSAKHSADMRRYLAIWMAALGAKADLRLVTGGWLEAVLDKRAPVVANGKKPKPGQAHHPAKRNKLRVALMNYCRWLVKKKDRSSLDLCVI